MLSGSTKVSARADSIHQLDSLLLTLIWYSWGWFSSELWKMADSWSEACLKKLLAINRLNFATYYLSSRINGFFRQRNFRCFSFDRSFRVWILDDKSRRVLLCPRPFIVSVCYTHIKFTFQLLSPLFSSKLSASCHLFLLSWRDNLDQFFPF